MARRCWSQVVHVGLVGVVVLLVGAAASPAARASSLTWSFTGQLTSAEHVEALACPSAASCTALLYRGDATAEYTFSPIDPARHSEAQVDTSGYAGQLACPSATLCVFGDIQGGVTTFDPQDSGAQDDWQPTDAQIQALACPSPEECVLVDTQGGEQTFDPATLGTAQFTGQVETGANWLSCPSTTQCTAVGSEGVQTFDPLTPPRQASPAGDSVDGATALLGVSCPSTTDCITVDYNAFALAFDPQAIADPTPQTTGAAEAGAPGEPGQPLSIDCPSVSDCVVASESGDAYQGDPQTGAWQPEAVEDSGLAALACPTADLCVSADLDSRVDIGTVIPSGLGSGLGFVSAVTSRPEEVAVKLLCFGAVDDRCVFTLRLAAGTGASAAATRTVTEKQGTATVTVGLSATARRRLAGHPSLSAALTISQRRVGFTAVLAQRRVTVHRR